MDHETAIQGLYAERYLLGELDAVERKAYEAHFFKCDLCVAEIAAGMDFIDALKGGSKQ